MAIEVQLLLGLTNGIILGLVISLLALGLSLIFGLIGIVNLAHGEFYMLGGVVAWYAVNFLGGYVAALLLAPLIVGALGLGIERGILRRLQHQPSTTIIATIGILFIIQHGVLGIFGPAPRKIDPPIEVLVQLPGFGYPVYRLLVAAISAGLLLALWTLMYRTNFGLFVRAAQQNREVAAAVGVPVARVYTLTFGLSAGLAGLAAALAAPLFSVHYLSGLDVLVLSFIVVIIGGLGSLRGAVFAAMLVSILEGVSSAFVTPTEARILSLLLIVAILLLRPFGLFGRRA